MSCNHSHMGMLLAGQFSQWAGCIKAPKWLLHQKQAQIDSNDNLPPVQAATRARQAADPDQLADLDFLSEAWRCALDALDLTRFDGAGTAVWSRSHGHAMWLGGKLRSNNQLFMAAAVNFGWASRVDSSSQLSGSANCDQLHRASCGSATNVTSARPDLTSGRSVLSAEASPLLRHSLRRVLAQPGSCKAPRVTFTV